MLLLLDPLFNPFLFANKVSAKVSFSRRAFRVKLLADESVKAEFLFILIFLKRMLNVSLGLVKKTLIEDFQGVFKMFWAIFSVLSKNSKEHLRRNVQKFEVGYFRPCVGG